MARERVVHLSNSRVKFLGVWLFFPPNFLQQPYVDTSYPRCKLSTAEKPGDTDDLKLPQVEKRT